MQIPPPPYSFACTPESVVAQVEDCPNLAAVFLIWPNEGAPYLGKTGLLRRRLKRLLSPRERASRFLHLGGVAKRVEYWPYASRLEASLLMYSLAREHHRDDYTRILKLRQPSYVKLNNNPFPRTMVTSRLSGSDSLHYGPFSSRAAAEMFEAGFLDFFQLRRCQEDLEPSAEHPGCVYGEMNKCLRPCQLVVTPQEYASEANRVAAFLSSNGDTLVDSICSARDKLSEEMEFEEAARMHKRLEKATAVVQSRGELATDTRKLNGVAVLPSTEAESVNLIFLLEGTWRRPIALSLKVEEGKPAPLDRKVREAVASIPAEGRISIRERQDHLSILAGWFFSSWRDGQWVQFESLDSIPYRKLVNAIHRIAKPQ